MQFTTDQRKPWYIQALRPDGSPLTFGYDVLDLQENNIGVVGQGSRLFIRVDEIPTGIKVALNDEQNGNDSNLLIVFYVQIMPDDFVMQLHRF